MNRTEKRFRKNRPASLIGPNAYLKDIHAEIEFEDSYKPFNDQSTRFPKPQKSKLDESGRSTTSLEDRSFSSRLVIIIQRKLR